MAQEFSARFTRHKDELEWLFMELYNNREGLEVLEREMADAYDARSAELKALDKARAADPNWYKRGNMFGMTMYTDLFAGNLKELAKKLPYFKEQKLTYLHLMPLLQMPHPHNDGGYAVEDFDTVDPALGTNKDLENLTRELRKAGISLCLDFVMNHTASTHRWAMAAKAGDPWFQAYYHLFDDRTIPDRVRADRAAGISQHCARQLYLVRGDAQVGADHLPQLPVGSELRKPGGVRGHDQKYSASGKSGCGSVPH